MAIRMDGLEQAKKLTQMRKAFGQDVASTAGSQYTTGSKLPWALHDVLSDEGIRGFLSHDLVIFEQRLEDLSRRLSLLQRKKWSLVRERRLLEEYCDEIVMKGEQLVGQLNDQATAKRVKQIFRRHISRWLAENPFIWRGLQKPRGYPGDYMMMLMGYDGVVTNRARGLSSELDRICYKKYRAIPFRKERLKELIIDFMERANRSNNLKILTLGGGPCREWIELGAARKNRWGEHRVDLTYLDQDEKASAFSREHLRNNRLISAVEYRNETLLSFVKSPSWEDRHNMYDFVYILGVADYLKDGFLTNVIAQGLSLIRQSGKFVVTQKDRLKFNLEFLDWFCDWSFIKRDEGKFMNVLREAMSKVNRRFKCEIIREKTGQIMFGIITKL